MDEIRMAIECRTDENRLGPGRIVGTIMAYNTMAKDRAEKFLPGSLKWDGALILNRMHTRASPIMRIVPVIEGNDLKINEQIPDSTAGRDAASEIRSGLMTGLSIEFRSIQERMIGGVREISNAVLGAVGLVDDPSYGASSVELRGKKRRQIWL